MTLIILMTWIINHPSNKVGDDVIRSEHIHKIQNSMWHMGIWTLLLTLPRRNTYFIISQRERERGGGRGEKAA